MLSFPWEDKEAKPYFVNEEGFEWWKDPDIQKYVDKKLSGLKIFAFLVKKEHDITRVLINDRQQIIYDSKSLEAVCVFVDCYKAAKRGENGLKR